MSNENQKGQDERIVMRLDAIISILLDKSKLEQLTMLDKLNTLTKMGFSLSDTARILGTTVESIKSQKYRKRGTGKK